MPNCCMVSNDLATSASIGPSWMTLSGIWMLIWGPEAAEQYGTIRADLEADGTPIGAIDMMIAAHARSLKAVLVTNNQKHFSKVKTLRIENWA